MGKSRAVVLGYCVSPLQKDAFAIVQMQVRRWILLTIACVDMGALLSFKNVLSVDCRMRLLSRKL
jgi:hypothetical protein